MNIPKRRPKSLPTKPATPEKWDNHVANHLCLTSVGSVADGGPMFDPYKTAVIKEYPLFRLAAGESIDEVCS